MSYLKNLPNLQTLFLTIPNISYAQLKELAKLLESNTNIESFKLASVNNINEDLFATLGNNNKLKKLDFSVLDLSDEGIKILGKKLLNNKSINTLIFRNRIITQLGVQSLIKLLENNVYITNIEFTNPWVETPEIEISLIQLEHLLKFNQDFWRKQQNPTNSNIKSSVANEF